MPLKGIKTAVRRFHCGSRTPRLCWEELPDESQVLAFVAKTEDGPGHLWLKTTAGRQRHSQSGGAEQPVDVAGEEESNMISQTQIGAVQGTRIHS